MQTKLASLGYLPTTAITGKYDYRTMQAVLAFQAWSGLARDGVVGPMTQAKLAAAGPPASRWIARARAGGSRSIAPAASCC